MKRYIAGLVVSFLLSVVVTEVTEAQIERFEIFGKPVPKLDEKLQLTDFKYTEDYRFLPKELHNPVIKSGKNNGFEFFKTLMKDENLSKEESSLVLNILDQIGKKKLSLSNAQKKTIKDWDRINSGKIEQDLKQIEQFDYCQPALNFQSSAVTQVGIDKMRLYVLAASLASNVNEQLLKRMNNLTRALNFMRSCNLTSISTIIDIVTTEMSFELVEVLAKQNKIKPETVKKAVAMYPGEEFFRREMAESFKREFWLEVYTTTKQFENYFRALNEIYIEKYPGKTPVYDSAWVWKFTGDCAASQMRVALTSKEPAEATCDMGFIKNVKRFTAEKQGNPWDRLHEINQDEPYLLSKMWVVYFTHRVEKSMLQDLKRLDNLVSSLK